MEDWQVSHIDKSLPTLIETTRCTTMLRSRLKAAQVLSSEETEILKALKERQGCYCATEMLYVILKTRIGGYKALMDALEETNQTGARYLLMEGYQGRDIQAERNLTQQFLDTQVELSGTIRTIREVLPLLQDIDDFKILHCPETITEINESYKNKQVVKLQCTLRESHPLYIARSISNRLLLDPEIFKISCADIFVYKGVKIDELVRLVSPNVIGSSTVQRSLVTCRHIYLDDDEDWDDLQLVGKVPIHLVIKEDGDYVLQRSSKVTSILYDNSKDKTRSSDAYISEDEFVEKIISDKENKGALVCDVPGMGKTWLMESVAWKIQHRAKNTVVFFAQLSLLANHLGAKGGLPEATNTLKFMLSFLGCSPLVIRLLVKHADKNGIKMIFVLDGFDEIIDVYLETTTKFMTNLFTNSNVRLILSSRQHMRKRLQVTFNLISYDILPFAREEQTTAIVGRWRDIIPEGDYTKLVLFAKQCIESFQIIQQEDTHDILGVPLKCFLLSVVNETRARQVSNLHRKKEFVVDDVAKIHSIFELYELSFNALVERRMPTKDRNEMDQDLFSQLVKYHTHEALKLLFPDIAEVYGRTFVADPSNIDFVIKVGVLFESKLSTFEFIHRTFAEYFSGKFFADFWIEINSFKPSVVQTFGGFFIKNVLNVSHEEKYFSGYLINLRDRYLKANANMYRETYSRKFASFTWYTVLCFMNSKSRTHPKREPVVGGFQQNINSKQSAFWDLYKHNRENIKRYFHLYLLCSIQHNLHAISSIVILLIRSSLDENQSRRATCGATDYLGIYTSTLEEKDFLAIVLCMMADQGCPETASEFLYLMDVAHYNKVMKLCKHFPRTYCSPLEVAVLRNNLDMFIFFHDKVNDNPNRLFSAALCGDCPGKTRITVKSLIVEKIEGDRNTFLTQLHLHDFSHQNTERLRILRKVWWKCKFSLKSANHSVKQRLLMMAIEEDNDEEIMKLFLLLFPSIESECVSLPESLLNVTIETVLPKLDLNEAKNTVSNMPLFDGHIFSKINGLESLKVFLKMSPNFDGRNWKGRNYLHYAVAKGNLEWIDHLIEVGHNINQKDNSGNSPLLRITTKELVTITRKLVNSRADVYGVNTRKRNVAHKLLSVHAHMDNLNIIMEWINFMLEKKYKKLWSMKDEDSYTPLDLLSKKLGKDHPFIDEVLQLLQKHKVWNVYNIG